MTFLGQISHKIKIRERSCPVVWCASTVKQSLLRLTIVGLLLAQLRVVSGFLRVTTNYNTFTNDTTK